jgi:hypothetical protein
MTLKAIVAKEKLSSATARAFGRDTLPRRFIQIHNALGKELHSKAINQQYSITCVLISPP